MRSQRARRRRALPTGRPTISTATCSTATAGTRARVERDAAGSDLSRRRTAASAGEKMAQFATPRPDGGPQAAVDASRSLVQFDAAAKRQRYAEHPVVAELNVPEPAGLLGRRGPDQRSSGRWEERPDRVAQREQARPMGEPGSESRRPSVPNPRLVLDDAGSGRDEGGVVGEALPQESSVPAGIRSSASQNATYGVVTRPRPKLRGAPSVSLLGVRTTSTPSSWGRRSSEALSTTSIRAGRSWSRRLSTASASAGPAYGPQAGTTIVMSGSVGGVPRSVRGASRSGLR